jgi:hypothetical protein
MANSSPQDAIFLKQILRGGSTTLHCVNELNHPVLSAWCTLDESCQRPAEWFETSDHWLLTVDSAALRGAPTPALDRRSPVPNLAVHGVQRLEENAARKAI